MAFRRVDHPAAALTGGGGGIDVVVPVVTPPKPRIAPAPTAKHPAVPLGAQSNATSLVSIEQAATLAGVARRTIYYWIAKRLIRTQRVASGRIRIERESLFKQEPAA